MRLVPHQQHNKLIFCYVYKVDTSILFSKIVVVVTSLIVIICKLANKCYREDEEFPNKVYSSLNSFLFIQRANFNVSCMTIYASLHLCRESMVFLITIIIIKNNTFRAQLISLFFFFFFSYIQTTKLISKHKQL